MFYEMGYCDAAALAAMHATSEPFFAKGLETGSYQGWFAEAKDKIVAGGGIIVFEYHSSPIDPFPKRPVVVNMYTEPDHRRRGLARMLMETMIAWCRTEGFGSVLLHASPDGRALYESLGFKQTNEMRLMLR